MTKLPVTMVTRDATLDDLSLTDYVDMVQDLRGRDSVTGAYAELGGYALGQGVL